MLLLIIKLYEIIIANFFPFVNNYLKVRLTLINIRLKLLTNNAKIFLKN